MIVTETSQLKIPELWTSDTHLGLETHVEHSVSFIKHYVCTTTHIRHSAAVRRQHVDHSTRGAHNDFGTSFQLGDLLRNTCWNIRNGFQFVLSLDATLIGPRNSSDSALRCFSSIINSTSDNSPVPP